MSFHLDNICTEGVLLFQFNNNNTPTHQQGCVINTVLIPEINLPIKIHPSFYYNKI